MEKDYKAMDVRSLLKEVETMCGWDESMKERISESIFSARKNRGSKYAYRIARAWP